MKIEDKIYRFQLKRKLISLTPLDDIKNSFSLVKHRDGHIGIKEEKHVSWIINYHKEDNYYTYSHFTEAYEFLKLLGILNVVNNNTEVKINHSRFNEYFG